MSYLSRRSIDLKRYYSSLLMSQDLCQQQNIEREKTLQFLKPTKGYIRDIFRLDREEDEYFNAHPNEKFRAYPDAENAYDSRYCKYILPYHMSQAEKDEYIDDEWCHWYNPWEDGRDCTGVWFTSYIKLIDISDGRTIVIHYQSCDV